MNGLSIYTIECNVLGAIFDRNVKLNSAILKYAIETANTRILGDSDFELGFQYEAIEYGNEFEAAQTVCNLLKVSAPISYQFNFINSQLFHETQYNSIQMIFTG